MDLVIDIQGFRDDRGQFIPKEVAVLPINFNKNFVAHFIITPPCPFQELSKPWRTQNNYLTKHHHRIEWFEGNVLGKQLHSDLREIVKNADRIYARGVDKIKFLENISAREIINLEEWADCPSFTNLPASTEHCYLHVFRDGSVCALNYAYRLKTWLETKLGKKRDEQSRYIASFVPIELDRDNWRISRGSDSEGVDETDGDCGQH